MVAEPEDTPVTIPETSTLAIVPSLLLHVPPVGDADAVRVLPAQTAPNPLIAEGKATTVIVLEPVQP